MHKDTLNLAEESRSRTRQSKNAKYLFPKISSNALPLLTQPGPEMWVFKLMRAIRLTKI